MKAVQYLKYTSAKLEDGVVNIKATPPFALPLLLWLPFAAGL